MRGITALACAALLATPGLAQAPAAQKPLAYGPALSADQARTIIERGIQNAKAKGLTMAFAVVEPSGELVAFARMDDTPYASSQIAQQKARSSARFRLPTKVFEDRVQGGRMVLLSSDEVIAIGGGVPIIVGGKVAGALGVSGGSAADDAAIADATLLATGQSSTP
ncbi:MAG: heme-binding protein [Pseudomonadota bacterium]